MIPARYKVTAWHGETGSIFYVVDTHAPEDEQPAVVREYSTRALAVMSRDNLNSRTAS